MKAKELFQTVKDLSPDFHQVKAKIDGAMLNEFGNDFSYFYLFGEVDNSGKTIKILLFQSDYHYERDCFCLTFEQFLKLLEGNPSYKIEFLTSLPNEKQLHYEDVSAYIETLNYYQCGLDATSPCPDCLQNTRCKQCRTRRFEHKLLPKKRLKSHKIAIIDVKTLMGVKTKAFTTTGSAESRIKRAFKSFFKNRKNSKQI